MRFESDKLMIVFPELYMASPTPFDKFDYRAGVGEGLECSMGRENGRAKGKLEKILFQRSMGDHTPRCLQAVSADRHHVWLVQSIEPAALGWVRTVKAGHLVS